MFSAYFGLNTMTPLESECFCFSNKNRSARKWRANLQPWFFNRMQNFLPCSVWLHLHWCICTLSSKDTKCSQSTSDQFVCSVNQTPDLCAAYTSLTHWATETLELHQCSAETFTSTHHSNSTLHIWKQLMCECFLCVNTGAEVSQNSSRVSFSILKRSQETSVCDLLLSSDDSLTVELLQ